MRTRGGLTTSGTATQPPFGCCCGLPCQYVLPDFRVSRRTALGVLAPAFADDGVALAFFPHPHGMGAGYSRPRTYR